MNEELIYSDIPFVIGEIIDSDTPRKVKIDMIMSLFYEENEKRYY